MILSCLSQADPRPLPVSSRAGSNRRKAQPEREPLRPSGRHQGRNRRVLQEAPFNGIPILFPTISRQLSQDIPDVPAEELSWETFHEMLLVLLLALSGRAHMLFFVNQHLPCTACSPPGSVR